MAFNLQGKLNRGRGIAKAKPLKVFIGVSALAAAMALLLFSLFFREGASYRPLGPPLNPQDAGAVINELKNQKIPYKITGDGSVVKVPAKALATARLNMAVKGLPSQKPDGYEIFDDQKSILSRLAQKANLPGAVTGELEQAISSLAEVQTAQVILNPGGALLTGERKEPAASVIIRPRQGLELDKTQLINIVRLVTAYVPGLAADNVSVLNVEGGLIWDKESKQDTFLNDDQLQRKIRYEESIRRRLQAMMERVVGPGRSITTVNADLDMTEVTTNEDIYDPERAAVRNERKIAESNIELGDFGGPNATYGPEASPGWNSAASAGRERRSRTEEVSNYEITNIRRRTVSRAGNLKKISVAVILDGIYTENKAGETIFRPQSDEFLAQLEDAVKAVIGFDEARGDIVSIANAPLAKPKEIIARPPFIPDIIREFYWQFFNIVLVLLFFFLVVRPVINWLKKETEGENGGAARDAPAEASSSPAPDNGASPAAASPPAEEQDMEKPPTLVYGCLSRENILPVARENLESAVALVRDWMGEKHN